MYTNELPGVQSPYRVEAGEGIRYAFGNQLATRIATSAELGQSAGGTVLTGAKGPPSPFTAIRSRTKPCLSSMESLS